MSKRRSSAEWRELIDEQAASGLSQKAYRIQQGIPLATFGYWKRNLRAEAADQGEEKTQTASLEGWIELPLRGVPTGTGWQIELDLGNSVCLRQRQG